MATELLGRGYQGLFLTALYFLGVFHVFLGVGLSISRKKKGKREYPNDVETKRMMKGLERIIESKADTPLIRQGKKQRIEPLINEAALLLARRARSVCMTLF